MFGIGQEGWQQHHLPFLALLLSSLCRARLNSSSVGSELLALESHLDMMFERMELNWFFRSALRCEMARIRSFSSLFFLFLTWGSEQQSVGNKKMVAKCNT